MRRLRILLLESLRRHGMEVTELEDGFELDDYLGLVISAEGESSRTG